jgi:hypothetical protein
MEPLQILAMNEDGKKNMKCKKEEIKGEEGKKRRETSPLLFLCVHAHAVVAGRWGGASPGELLLMVQNRAQVHRKPTGDLVPFSPRRVLPRFVNPRIGSKLLGFSI